MQNLAAAELEVLAQANDLEHKAASRCGCGDQIAGSWLQFDCVAAHRRTSSMFACVPASLLSGSTNGQAVK